jgi:hypothetical protein
MPTERTMQPKRRIGIAILSLVVLLPLYAFIWSDIFLWRIQNGMSKERVRQLVGEPIERRAGSDGETWDYTRRWSRHARVHFGPDGFVASVETD